MSNVNDGYSDCKALGRKILSLGTGREWEWFNGQFEMNQSPEVTDPIYITHVDQMYQEDLDSPHWLVGQDIFRYLEEYKYRDYDEIHAQRIFEHIPVDQIHYLGYLLYSVAVPGAKLVITVPDFQKVFALLNTLDADKLTGMEFKRGLIKVTTELFNEPSDPHQSPWTQALAKYYLEVEGYWKISSIEYVRLDGRDWYMKITADRQN